MELAAIILGAGRSTRFTGGGKLLAELDGRPLLAHVLEKVAAYPFVDRLLITGHRHEETSALAERAGLRVVENTEYVSGLASSLRAGFAALAPEIEGAMVLLGDMPLIAPVTLHALASAAEANPEMSAIVPSFRGEWGNPVLVRRVLFGDIAGLTGDQGARKLIVSRTDTLVVPVEDPGILADIDTHEALLAAMHGPIAGLRS